MADSAISGLDPTPQELSEQDITIISQNVNGAWLSVKMTLSQLKTFIRFGLDISSIFGLTDALSRKANSTHGHTIGDVSGLTNALAGKAASNHTHNTGDISGLEQALQDKANINHTHQMIDITGLDQALAAKLDENKVGVANGVATLGADGKVPQGQLPQAFIWIIVEDDYSLFPEEGIVGVLYIDDTTNITYRWNGTTYITTSGDIIQLTLGDGVDQAYPGNKGKIAYDHSQTNHAPADAQKNSDITQAEIEAKLIGDISSHGHTIEKIAGLRGELDGKAPSNHTHVMSEITGLNEALDQKLNTDEKDAVNGIPSLDGEGLLKLTQFPGLNFILTPTNIVVDTIIRSSGGITIPVDRDDVARNGDAFSGSLTSPTRALDFNYEWVGNNPAIFSFVQGEKIQFKFIETNNILTDTSDPLIVELEFEDVDLGNGQTGRQAKVTVSNSEINEIGTMMAGADGNQIDLRFERGSGMLNLFLENYPILSVDVGVVHNFMYFIEADNTLKTLNYILSNTFETTYNLPFDLEDGVLYRVSVECVINSRNIYPGDCFVFYQNKARILIFRSSLRQQQLEDEINNHTHLITQVEGLEQQLNAFSLALSQKAPIVHAHAISDITGLQTFLDNVTQQLGQKAASTHTHVIANITGLQTLLTGLRTDVDGKANAVHTHTIAQVTGLQTELAGKAPIVHEHPEITAKKIMLDGFVVAAAPGRIADGDDTQTALQKVQRQLDLLSGFSQNVFEPSNDFPFVLADGTLYKFGDGDTLTTNQSLKNITLAPGYYRIIVGAACEYVAGQLEVDGKWTRVYKTSNSSEVYASQTTLGDDVTAIGEYQSKGNPPYGRFAGVGYASNLVFPYLYKGIEELHRGVDGNSSGSLKGTQSGAISVSTALIVSTPLDLTLLLGSNADYTSPDPASTVEPFAGFVWIRELSAGSVTTPNQFVLVNSIFDGAILGWDGVGEIEISPDTFKGYRAVRPNFTNDEVAYVVPTLGTPTGDVVHNLGLQSEDGLVKFIELVYVSAAGGSFSVKNEGVDLFGELFSTLPSKVKVRSISPVIYEVALLDNTDAITNKKVVFTGSETDNRFYIENLCVESADVTPSLVSVESLSDSDGAWFNAGAVADFVRKVLYWNRSNKFNIGSPSVPQLIDQYSSARAVAVNGWVEFDVSVFDENDVKSIDLYLATSFDVNVARTTNVGHVSLNNVDNAGTIVTTLTNFVVGEIELVDAAALAINKIKFTRSTSTAMLVEYDNGSTVVSNTFTTAPGTLFVLVEVRTSTGVEIINLPYNFGTA